MGEDDSSSLKWFEDHEFHDALDETYEDIDPSQSKNVFTDDGIIDKGVSVFVLFWRALQQAWPIVIIGMALIGWREPIRTFLQAIIGIEVSVLISMFLTGVAITTLTTLGYLLFFRWGSQTKTFLSNQKQNVAQALDYRFKRAMAIWAGNKDEEVKNLERRLDTLESRIEEMDT